MKILAEKNVSVAEFEKVSKYKDLEIEVEKLWHMKTVTIPVVIGVLDMIKTGNEKHLQKIPWSPNLAEMPKNSPYRYCSYPKTNLISVKTNKTMNNWNNVECTEHIFKRFLIRVWPLAMCRGELSAVITRLMYKCLRSEWKW